MSDARAVVVDNGWNYGIDYKWQDGVEYTRCDLCCYAEAMNRGVKYSAPNDWIIIINNDVLCTGDIDTSKLDKNTIYGAKKHERWGREWLDGWFFMFHRDAWEDVGEFDENFEKAAFEDADWCFRAQDKGYKINVMDVPFVHLETSDRLKDGSDFRDRNLEYLISKWSLKHDI